MNQARFREKRIRGSLPGLVKSDLDLIELIQAGKRADFCAVHSGYQPQLPVLSFFDLQSPERFGVHNLFLVLISL
jgi:hypothetical protein